MDKSSESSQSTCNKRPSLDERVKSPSAQKKKKSERYWQNGKPLEECLLHMYVNKLWTDVSFRCKGNDGENTTGRILAHRNILSARSPVFEAMLYGRFAEDEIELGSIEAEVFDLVLRFVYGNETRLINENAVRVLEVAHMYQLTSLVEYCTTYIYSILQPDNACEMLDLALHYDLKPFIAKVQVYIDDHATEVLKSDGFISVSQQCLTRILKRDTFNVDEKDIVDRTMQWADRKCTEEKLEATGENKRKVLGDAFFQLRMTTLKMKNFLQFTRQNNYYSKEESEDICSRIVGGCEVTPSFHNLVPRVPRKVARKVQDIVIGHEAMYVNEIYCFVEAEVSRKIYIKGFTLKNVWPHVGNRESGRWKTDVGPPLHGKLMVEGHKRVMFEGKPLKGMTFSFKKSCSLCLLPREKPYGIAIELTYGFNTYIALKAFQSLKVRQQAGQSNKDSNNIQQCGIADVRFTYSDRSKHVNCIESFSVINISN